MSREGKAILEVALKKLHNLLLKGAPKDDEEDEEMDGKSFEVKGFVKRSNTVAVILSEAGGKEAEIELNIEQLSKLLGGPEFAFKTREEVIAFVLAKGTVEEQRKLHEAIGIMLGITELDEVGALAGN